MLRDADIKTGALVGGQTMVKRRYVERDTSRIIFRHDDILRFRQNDVWNLELSFDDLMRYENGNFDAIVVSDYDKGTITGRVLDEISANKGTLRIVDSKRRDLSTFRDFDILKLNWQEYCAQQDSARQRCLEEMFGAVVVTRGDRGAELRMFDRAASAQAGEGKFVVHAEKFKVEPIRSVDVTGCGDTHTAAMAWALINDPLDVRSAVRFANKCAGDVVRKFGTSVVDPA
jgi:bifunctional ADP-heptose synthase (sugar kinase/adenylyltransferase)